jgi:polyhydroxyalkanoate synthase
MSAVTVRCQALGRSSTERMRRRGRRPRADDLIWSDQVFAALDGLRQMQGEALGALGFGPTEAPYRVVTSRSHWRLRDYGPSDSAPPLLIVAAPIKRPYLWDLAPAVSAVRYCLQRGLHVFLLEWVPPSGHARSAGLADYADRAIGQAVAAVSRADGETHPFVIGHSLGGTLVAIFATLHPESIRGLVLLGAPLCFQRGVSRFRDAIVAMAPSSLAEMEIVPGSLLSQLSALASPETFVWSRSLDAILSMADPPAWDLHARVERWALDEVSLSGRLVHQILHWLYHEDRLCKGTLEIEGRIARPSCLRAPVLAVVNTADEIAPLASVRSFLDAVPGPDVSVLDHPGELGVGLQHLGILIGRQAFARVWPRIIAWIRDRSPHSECRVG